MIKTAFWMQNIRCQNASKSTFLRHMIVYVAVYAVDYIDPKDNAAFERCIDVMSRLILKYGPDMHEKVEQKEMRNIHCEEADHVL